MSYYCLVASTVSACHCLLVAGCKYSVYRSTARRDVALSSLSHTVRGHLLHFMRTECNCEQLPRTLVQTKSLQITITGGDGTKEQFRVHAWPKHHGRPWYDAVQMDVEVHGFDAMNCIGIAAVHW